MPRRTDTVAKRDRFGVCALLLMLVFCGCACGQQVASALPPNSTFEPPALNACRSTYDQFYGSEPGVTALWALCEPGSNPSRYDYVGIYDLIRGHGAWGNGTTSEASPGPVPDGEPGAEAANAGTFLEAQGLMLNSHEGTAVAWIRSDLQTSSPAVAVFFGAVNGKSMISISSSNKADKTCFSGLVVDAEGSRTPVMDDCSTPAGAWRRVALVWTDTTVTLYVNGVPRSTSKRAGALEDKVFYYRFFPSFGIEPGHMALAKVEVANQAWSAEQIAKDHAPVLNRPPLGGVLVTADKLGTIHEDVLGYQDNNANISDSDVVTAMLKGLRAAGVRAVRYSSGAMGIEADKADWRGGASCKSQEQQTPAPHGRTGNDLDSYFDRVVKPLSLHTGYVVNYGSNPPQCTAGGDPKVNGADLVHIANVEKHLGIRYWEIGNEQYAGGKSELDLHPHPADGVSYAAQETAFYRAMKAEDPSAQIGVPIGTGVFSWETQWSLPVLRDSLYDAAIFHSYPMRDPISDGSTLYPDRVASNLARTHGSLLRLQTMLLNAGKQPSDIWVTEWDGDVNGNLWSRQSMGAVMPLFATMQLAEFMMAGVRYATWLAQGSGDACFYYNFDKSAPSSYSWAGCGGTMITYTGPLSDEIKVGLKPGDLSPPAHALQLLSMSGFVLEGESMLRVLTDSQSSPWLMAYAATHKRGYGIILINRDRDTSHIVPLKFAGLMSGRTVEQWTYGREQYDATRTGDWSVPPVHASRGEWSGLLTAQLPPWSVNVLIVQ
jgi:hypothetical protein